MKRIVIIGLILASFTACDFDEPDVSDVGNFKLIKMDGRELKMSLDLKVENENPFGFKIKRGKLDVSADGSKLGVVELDQKVKIKRKSNKKITIPLLVHLEEGAMVKLIALRMKSSADMKFDGKVRGSVMGIGKTIEVHETKKINPKELNLGE